MKRRAGAVMASVLALASVLAAPPASALPVADGEVRIEVPVNEAQSCVVLPESQWNPEACKGIDQGAVRQKLRESSREGIEPIAMVVGRGTPAYLLTVIRDVTSQNELDRPSIETLVTTLRKRMLAGMPTDAGQSAEPTEERINGLQVIAFDAVAEDSPDERVFRHNLFHVVATGQGHYTLSWACSSADLPAVTAMARQSVSSVKAPLARPLIKRGDQAVSPAGAWGDTVWHLLAAVAQLAAIAAGIVLFLRYRKKKSA